MKINDLINKKVKLSKNSVVCYDENYKILGIIKDTKKFNDLPPRDLFEYAQIIKNLKIRYSNDYRKYLYIKDKKLYYFYDLRRYNQWIKNIEAFKRYNDNEFLIKEQQKIDYYNQICEELKDIAIIIKCYIVE